MLKDECIVLNYNDEVLGADNKYNVHKFLSGQPKGMCHRAFSVMLFDAEGKLLLQQRAASKITFPRVWTNTVCSHPLYGQEADEVDGPMKANEEPIGVKRAAVRKIAHELGTKAGATKAESDSPSSESSAKPSSLMVPSIILAYAKSVAVISVMPAQAMSSSSTLRPNASLMRILSLLRASWPPTSSVGSASA